MPEAKHKIRLAKGFSVMGPKLSVWCVIYPKLAMRSEAGNSIMMCDLLLSQCDDWLKSFKTSKIFQWAHNEQWSPPLPLPPPPSSHLATLCSWNVHLLEVLDICGGEGAEGWFPLPFDGPSAKLLLIACDGMFGKKTNNKQKQITFFCQRDEIMQISSE